MTGNKYSLVKRVALAAAIAAGMSGVANAGMGRFEDIYRYFDIKVIDKSPSAWRQANPHGLTGSELQALSSEAPEWQLNKPVFASAPAFKQTHPNGLTESELQALSSDAPAFHLANGSGATAIASDNQTDVAPSSYQQTFVARLASFFHLAK